MTGRRRTALWSALYCLALVLPVRAALVWGRNGEGFLGRGGLRCDSLQSAGGDDDAMVIAFLVMALPLAIRALRPTRPMPGWEMALFAAATLLAIGGVALAALDCARILFTIAETRDITLAGAYAGLPVAYLAARRLTRR